MPVRPAGAAILAIDQGTTSSRAIAFDLGGGIVASAQQPLPQHFPRDGWVEQDPEDIWRTVLETARQAVAEAQGKGFAVAAIGIVNQRETTVVWDRGTGRAIHNAIVWQDRRGAERCRALVGAGAAPAIRKTTGLVPDSYFSATKLEWLLDHVDGAGAAARNGELAFGTVDSFLLWRLTGGAVHATDATNASRTMLFDIEAQGWDGALCREFGVPDAVLPEVRDSAGPFGTAGPEIFGAAIPVTGIAGDQQAALVGQGCLTPGMAKSTYGTGCFILVNAGRDRPEPGEGILATVAWRLGGETVYAAEGAIFNAGTAVQWLRDGLGIIADSAASEALAAGLADNGGVYLVPAFTGLGAPWWDAGARGGLFGLTRDTGAAHLARAALEACGYQTADLLEAMGSPEGGNGLGSRAGRLRVDGGMAANDWLMQFIADIAGAPVERPAVTETTALGAALLAGVGAGLYGSLEEAVAATWRPDRIFTPSMVADRRRALRAGWRAAVERVRSE
ncbi:MAG: glycerol kinase GlpK [Rhodospirillaceae bacterium]|nr:glycerol kinase GlpK [Rhodospirillaceae bacterium]MYF87562.1 glycerol kinase GlpK [Rhodospirillaceae bacterium]MYH37414.1 glycerol kinase GlpK [Rhodospirillaceae bacterium]MYK14920.1 glycerol kinase GlpK [Rhodospirillaceae bacterium]MYK60185.1 glycerol kinase GlpK [Rhodospirillaceae bacterium]